MFVRRSARKAAVAGPLTVPAVLTSNHDGWCVTLQALPKRRLQQERVPRGRGIKHGKGPGNAYRLPDALTGAAAAHANPAHADRLHAGHFSSQGVHVAPGS